MGKSEGIRTGLSHARGEYFVIQDADLEYDPKDVVELLNYAKQHHANVVYGSRFLGSIENMPKPNLYANRFYNTLLHRLYKTDITDMHTCYKMVKTKILLDLDLKANRFDYAPELVSKLLKRGFKINELPIKYHGRTKKDGKKIGLSDGIKCTWLIIKYKLLIGTRLGRIDDKLSPRKQDIKFLVIGGIGFVVNFAVLQLMSVGLDLNRVISEIIAVVVALHVTFICHNSWTYKINRKTHAYNFSLLKRYRAYFISNSFSSFLTIVSFSLFSIILTHLPALVLGSFIGLLWNFVMNKKVIWHHKPITNTTVSGVK